MTIEALILIACLFVLALNVAVLALNIKLYTEILKDSAMNKRAAKPKPQYEDDNFPF